MIPILFASTETTFTSNGIGRLVDCISCEVTEERNGIYELELQYPITGKWFDELMQGGIIGVIHDDNHDIQPFDIYKTETSIDGVVIVNAHHISYRLNNIILEPYTASSASAAVAGITTHSVNTNPFTFSTNKTTTANFELTRPHSVRSILFGEQGSLLDTFGTADFKFDKFSVQMLTNRGTNTGVTVRYGKNMTAIEWIKDDSETCNAFAPFWTNGTDTVYLSETIVQPTVPITPLKPATVDFSDRFEMMPTEAQLRAEAKSYLDANTPWIPSDTIKVDFTALWQTTDYENVAAIQRVGLCDTVSIYWTDMGIVSEQAKVVKVTYDVLAERFTSMEVGTSSNSYVATTDDIQSSISAIPSLIGTVFKNGNDKYVKFPNGLMICWRYIPNISIQPNHAWGSWYWDDITGLCDLGSWPQTFKDAPDVVGHLYGTQDGILGAIQQTTTTAVGKAYIYTPVSYNSSITVNVSVIGIGRWK